MAPESNDDLHAGDSLRSLIRMARDDFDEEPSPRIDALLMAAARHHAPAPQLGVFARLRRWLGVSMMNPAVAGVTALVVIGGTAGVLYMRNPRRVAEPTVDRGGPSSVIAPRTPEVPAAPPSELDKQLDDGKVQLREMTETAVTGPEPRPRPESRRGQPRTGTEKPPADTSGRGDGFAGGVGVFTEMKGLEQQPQPPPPPPDTGNTELQIAGDADELEDTVVTESMPRNTTVAPGRDSNGPEGSKDNRAQAENLLRQARTAAKKKNCPPVKVMAKQARKLDAAYYDANFSKDPDVKTCL